MRILVMDGEPLAREGLATLLGDVAAGAMVIETGDLSEALHALARDPGIRLVIADPGPGGATGAACAFREVRRDVGLVFLSADGGTACPLQADGGGFRSVSKRAPVAELAREIGEAVHRARAGGP